jgi:hypothetical protein
MSRVIRLQRPQVQTLTLHPKPPLYYLIPPPSAEVSDHMLISRVMHDWRGVRAQGRRAEMPWCRRVPPYRGPASML